MNDNTPGFPSCGDDENDPRAGLKRRLDQWLEQTLAAEEPPRGLDAELLNELLGADAAPAEPARPAPGPDRYALWSALTALTQESRLQGRAFDRLSQTLAALATLEPAVREWAEANAKLLARTGEDARLRDQRELLEPLLDTRERLGRSLHAIDQALARHRPAPPRRWLPFGRGARRTAAELAHSLHALREGCALSLARLNETLAELGLHVAGQPGSPFDPRLMQAVEITPTDEVPEGTVLEVVRPGYTWRGEPYRAAQVRVARRPAPAKGNPAP